MIDQTDVVSKFASLIGTKRTSKEPPPAAASLVKSDPKDLTSRELLMCISKSVASDAVVCTLPSLDMRKLEQDPDSNLLPKVGEHFPMKMEASVLHNAAEASAKAAQVEQKAAQTLGSITSWTRSSLVYASKAISENAANSFSSLVESRVRAWTLLLLRHSLTGDSNSRSRLLSMLESIIKVNSAEIGFKPLGALPASTEKAEDDPDVILPLIAEVDLNITVHKKKDTVTLRAPGTISANFERIEDHVGIGLKSVDIRLDTTILLESMVKEARMVVFKAVSEATSASKSLSIDSDVLKQGEDGKAVNSALKLHSTAKIAGGLKMPGRNDGLHQPAHRAMKAQSSSLKLNRVLSSSTIQKTRSVQFGALDLRAKSDAIPKRQKLATTAKLTSFKSFGRPHAGDFGSDGGPKNATFASFGGSQKFWGRDGKLASKPRPQLPSETADMLTSQQRMNANATFDFRKPPIHLSSRSTGLGVGTQRMRQSALNRVPGSRPASMARTPTSLEHSLIEQLRRGKI